MTNSRVALIQGDDRRRNMLQALELIGDRIDWSSVRRPLVKPNFVTTDAPLAATHVDVVRALLDWLRVRYAGPIIIGEGSATRNTWEGFANYGYLSLPDEYPGVELRDLNDDEPLPVRVFDRQMRPLTLHAARTAVVSDCRIAIGPPKTHDAVILTLSLKNMIMGSLISRLAPCPPGQIPLTTEGMDSAGLACAESSQRSLVNLAIAGRGYYARLPGWIKNLSLVEWAKAAYLGRSAASSKQRMHQSLPLMNLNLFALAPVLRPHLSLIDGWEAMEGDGPTNGDAVTWRVALAGTDFLAVDALAAELMGHPIDGVGYLQYCHQAGLGAGSREDMDIVGNVHPDRARRIFRPSPTHRIQSKWQIEDADRWLEAAVKLNEEKQP